MKFYIKVDTIYRIVKTMFNDAEICGNLESSIDKPERLLLYDKMEGEKDGDRNMCRYKRYSPYLLHTHPKYSYAYPSNEDIMKMIKHKKINNQIIITSWGIWEIYRISPFIEMSSEKLEEIRKKVNLFTSYIGSKTRRENYDRVIHSTKSKDVEKEFIERQIEKFNQYISHKSINLSLTLWEDIGYDEDYRYYLHIHDL